MKEKSKWCELCGKFPPTYYNKAIDKWVCGSNLKTCPARKHLTLNLDSSNFYRKNPICDFCNEKKGVYFLKNYNAWSCEKNPQNCTKKRTTNDRKLIKMLNGKSMFCDYGCGRVAKYIFKPSATVCCSTHANQCPAKIRINSISKREYFKTEIKKIKKSKPKKLCKCGCRKMVFGNKFFNKKHLKNYYDRVGWHGGKIWKGKKRPEHSRKLKERAHHFRGKKSYEIPFHAKRYTIQKLKKLYPLFSTMEEMRYHPEKENIIQYHCKNSKCKNSKENGGWFTPAASAVQTRIREIERHDQDGGFLYCSKKCKKECNHFGVNSTLIAKEYLYGNDQCEIEKNYTDEEYQIFREEVLKRADYKCEYCGEPATDVHHSRPQKLEPFFALDPDYGIAACEKCHYQKGHIDECSTGRLANIICN